MEHVKKIIDALSKKEVYKEEVSEIELIHTAVSYVFLTGNYAYKLNKPLNLGFLDYTTLEKRKEILEKELKLNSLLCPDLYKEILPITEKNNKIQIAGNGKVIEYALKMKQFPQDNILTNKLKQNKVKENDMYKVAKIISDFHNKTPSNEEINQYGSFDAIQNLWQENFDQTKEFINKTITKQQFNLINNKIDSFLKDNKKVFDKRVKEKKIRYNHGDFHSGNICLGKDTYIFDRIVFNMKFPCSDIMAEAAFLAMDLDYHKKQNLSDKFIECYIKESKDKDGKYLLDFYKCYRAYIRGKIACFKLQDSNISEQEKNKTVEEAKSYFNLSHEYAKIL
ncbi:hypothetical protein HYT57_02645 [Candidatus Woesearchaeota archaeon]|nr:hypothetical protein [Candidatus Woesearchaeota archaeon]